MFGCSKYGAEHSDKYNSLFSMLRTEDHLRRSFIDKTHLSALSGKAVNDEEVRKFLVSRISSLFIDHVKSLGDAHRDAFAAVIMDLNLVVRVVSPPSTWKGFHSSFF